MVSNPIKSFLVTCRSCGTSNRVPADKEGVQGDCGNCKTVLPPVYWQPQQVTEATFEEFVAQFDGPILAEFWAPW